MAVSRNTMLHLRAKQVGDIRSCNTLDSLVSPGLRYKYLLFSVSGLHRLTDSLEPTETARQKQLPPPHCVTFGRTDGPNTNRPKLSRQKLVKHKWSPNTPSNRILFTLYTKYTVNKMRLPGIAVTWNADVCTLNMKSDPQPGAQVKT